MRLEKLRQKMEQEKLAGLLITQPENRRYLSDFSGSSAVLIITKERQVLATDGRYYEQVREQCPAWELAEVGYFFVENLLELLRQLELGGRSVGFEAEHVTVAMLHKWEQAIKGQLVLVHTKRWVESLRMQKDEHEIAALRKAIALADETLAHIITWMQPGMTEKQVAWELESYMRTHGASAISFAPIVASGPNGAKPHATPSERVLQIGEPVILDFGCIVDDYCSDLSRTVCLGEPTDDRYLKVWQTVYQAQQAAFGRAKAGMTGQAVDKLARDVIVEAGFKDNFGHGLGHSVGLVVHENPRFSFAYPEEIPLGATVTVEPGIYLPDWGGVRLEDIVWVQEHGVEVLSSATKEPIITVRG